MDLRKAVTRSLWWTAPAALAALVYLNSLGGVFMWDDRVLILNNPYTKNWSSMLGSFTPLYWTTVHSGMKGQYRPLRNISFTLDYSLWHENPFGYHLTNVALHAANAGLVALAAFEVFGSPQAALAAGVLFAVHPVHSESINYVKNRSDLLCTFFMLLAFLAWRRDRHFWGAACYALSFASKEIGAVLPVIIVSSTFLSYPREEWKKKLSAAVPYIGVMLAILAWKFMVLKVPAGAETIQPDQAILRAGPVLTVLSTVIGYVALLFFPTGLVIERPLPMLHSVIGVETFAAAAAAALALYLLSRLKDFAKYVFALIWIAACLLPVANIIPLHARPFAEQRLYAASAGWALLLGGLVSYAFARLGVNFERLGETGAAGRIFLGFLSLWIAVWGVWIIKRNVIWRSEDKFWETSASQAPVNGRVWVNLADYYVRAGDFKKAESIYGRLLEYPQARADESIYQNMGIISQSKGDYGKALEFFLKASELDPYNAQIWNNVGSMYFLLKKPAKAREVFERGMGIDGGKGSPGIYTNMGILSLTEKKYDDALRYFRKAVELNPDLIEARVNLANIYSRFGMEYEAKEQLEEAKLRMKSGEGMWQYNPTIEVK